MTLQTTFGEEYGLPALDTPVRDRIDCANCGESHNPDHCSEIPNGDTWCEDCFNDTYCHCEDCAELITLDDSRRPEDRSGIYCETCYDARYVRCYSCDSEVRTNNAIEEGRHHYCEECHSEEFGECSDCGNTFHRDNLSYHEDNDADYCSSCYPSDDDDYDSDACNAKSFRRSSANTVKRIGSLRTFGVELETSKCSGFEGLDGRTHFSSRSDGSISGLEFVSEVLRGDEGLDAIADFCGKAQDFEVNASCGFHLHVGISDLDDEQRRNVCAAYALTQSLWFSFVPEKRRTNSYCRQLAWSANQALDCADFDSWAENQCRYQWLNVSAYAKHGTFEVRLHSATLEADKVCNWTIAHVKFIEWCASRPLYTIVAAFSGCTDQERFERMCAIWQDSELCEFYRARAEKFGSTYRIAREAIAA